MRELYIDKKGHIWPITETNGDAEREDVSVYITRRTDGRMARLDMRVREDEREDVWYAIFHHFPEAFDLLDTQDLATDVPDGYNPSGTIFREGEDDELCRWLREWTAEAFEMDHLREVPIAEARDHDTRKDAIDAAKEAADAWIYRQACDLAELVVIVRVAGEEVLRFEDAEWEASE